MDRLRQDLRYALRQLGRNLGFAASYLPARWATGVDPAIALRTE